MEFVKRYHKPYIGNINNQIKDEKGHNYMYYNMLICNQNNVLLRKNNLTLVIKYYDWCLPFIDDKEYQYRNIEIYANRINYSSEEEYKKLKKYGYYIMFPCNSIERIETYKNHNIYINHEMPSLKYINCLILGTNFELPAKKIICTEILMKKNLISSVEYLDCNNYTYKYTLPNLTYLKTLNINIDFNLPKLNEINGRIININVNLPKLQKIYCNVLKINGKLDSINEINCSDIELNINLPSLKKLILNNEKVIQTQENNIIRNELHFIKKQINVDDIFYNNLFDKIPNIQYLDINYKIILKKTIPTLKSLKCKLLTIKNIQYIEELIITSEFQYKGLLKFLNEIKNSKYLPNLKYLFISSKNIYYKFNNNSCDFYCSGPTIFNKNHNVFNMNKNLNVFADTHKLYFKNLNNLTINYYSNNIFLKNSYYYLNNIKNIKLNTCYNIDIYDINEVHSIQIKKNMLNYYIKFNNKWCINTIFLHKYIIKQHKIMDNLEFHKIMNDIFMQLKNNNNKEVFNENYNEENNEKKYLYHSYFKMKNDYTNTQIKLLNLSNVICNKSVKREYLKDYQNINAVIQDLNKKNNSFSIETKKALKYLIKMNFKISDDDEYIYLKKMKN